MKNRFTEWQNTQFLMYEYLLYNYLLAVNLFYMYFKLYITEGTIF